MPVVSMLAAMIGIPVHVLPLPVHRKGGARGNMSDVRSRRAPSDVPDIDKFVAGDCILLAQPVLEGEGALERNLGARLER